MPLVTLANLTARSPADPTMTFAERTLVRMRAGTMPPAPGTPATSAEIQTVTSWIAAGYPSGTCGATGGTGGAPDPFGTPAKCSSNTFWTGGNTGNPMMNPGRACISCHGSTAGDDDNSGSGSDSSGPGGGGESGDDDEGGPLFTIAGTVYPSAHEPDLCNGTNGSTTGATIVIVDAANRTLTLTPNAAGNFFTLAAVSTPFRAKVVYQGRERIMTVAQTTGDCNGCHTQNGASNAPGRILLP
jgi:hypothetical protein